MYLSKKDTPSPENYDIKGLYSQIISQKIIKINNNMKFYTFISQWIRLNIEFSNIVVTLIS